MPDRRPKFSVGILLMLAAVLEHGMLASSAATEPALTAEHQVMTTREPEVPANATLSCDRPLPTCEVFGYSHEINCSMVGMTGQHQWVMSRNHCNLMIYLEIETAHTHGIVFKIDFPQKSFVWDEVWFWEEKTSNWAAAPRYNLPQAIKANRVKLKLHVRRIHRQVPFKVSVQFSSLLLKHTPEFWYNAVRDDGVYDCHAGEAIILEEWKCDGHRQCSQGEDEKWNCDLPTQGCSDDKLAYEDQCFDYTFTWNPCDTCYEADWKQATFNTPRLRRVVTRYLRHLRYAMKHVFVGLRKMRPQSHRLAHLYRHLLQWGEGGPVAYQETVFAYRHPGADCVAVEIREGEENNLHPCDFTEIYDLRSICSKDNPLLTKHKHNKGVINLPQARPNSINISTKICSDGSLVHTFHPCPRGRGSDTSQWSARNLPLFPCSYGPPIHYTLVCDGNPDCDDDSDEDNCDKADLSRVKHNIFVCSSSQIIPKSRKCDGHNDCLDNSDEDEGCYTKDLSHTTRNWFRTVNDTPAPPAVVELDGLGGAKITALLSGEEGCGETHFQCPDGYCIPTYLIKNGEKDCFGGEDENIQKESFTCPGFYRCLESESCVHPKYVCDGVPHCLNHDDERYCDLVCPHNCSCEGYTFTCRQTFDYKPFLQMRYLDLSTIWRPSLKDINFVPFLHFLNLSRCGLTSIRLRHMPLLHVLDLSYNNIHNTDSLLLEQLDGLTHLDLSGNPLTQNDESNMVGHVSLSITGTGKIVSGTTYLLPSLRYLNLSRCGLSNVFIHDMIQLHILDLSYNSLYQLTSMQLGNLTGLTQLDVSGNVIMQRLDSDFVLFTKRAGLSMLQTLTMVDTGVDFLASGVFEMMHQLTSLDLRNNPLRHFSKDSLQGLGKLRVLRADIARVCCSYFHQGSVIEECDAPRDELSSCEDLLRTDLYRVFLWVLSMLTITGNAGVLIFKLFIEKEGTSLAFRVLVINLGVTDLLMGVYLAIIGSADAQFRGVYVAEDSSWRESNTCKAAGFLSFVSIEVSALTISLITLDRFLVIKFPFNSSIRLTRLSAVVVCGTIWTVGITLASVPLFKGEFYSQTGICLPLPITRQSFQGQDYAFGIFNVFNFVLFLMIGVGQALILHSIHGTTMVTLKGHRQQDSAIARRLFLIVCTDFCCWFPIGLMGLLASSGVPIPGVVNVWAAVFVMPINSVLNPFLYTVNALLERRAKKMEQQRIEKMMSKLRVELRTWPSDKVEDLLHFCLSNNLVQKQRIHLLRSREFKERKDPPKSDTVEIQNPSSCPQTNDAAGPSHSNRASKMKRDREYSEKD